jgi:hypothetical protein
LSEALKSITIEAIVATANWIREAVLDREIGIMEWRSWSSGSRAVLRLTHGGVVVAVI